MNGYDPLGYDKATYKISFFPDECFVRKWRLKFQVSKYRLRWNAENITQLPFLYLYEHFTTGNRLVCSQEKSQLAARASHKYNRNNYYIDGLLFQCFELPCACTYFFAVKTLCFTCLSIKLLYDTRTLVWQLTLS